ncbi:MAG: Ig-like domain-containing protein [Dysgonamonadaceae bacterium]|nr:Ig-like domain-containing protein [Dysgonamonadaceae bacterium]
MKKITCFIALLSLAYLLPAVAQNKVTGLSNVKLYLDPGHSRKENQGMYNYSEAEKTLRVALAVREYLLTYTDMQASNIRLCRTTDSELVSLPARTDEANAWGAHFYYSIHSDAATMPSSANTTLFLWGGWQNNNIIYEKTPTGGQAFGNILNPNLSGVMRTGTRGNKADRPFYIEGNTPSTPYPYLSVNRESNMASLLSEAGFHTTPAQQVRNLNAEWKRLEGYAAYQSLVKFLSGRYGSGTVNPVQIGIATGFITESGTGKYINGASVTITDGSIVKNYTTDSYESLFKNYSSDPNLLRNGFYFIEGLRPGATVNVKVEAAGYQTKETTLTIPSTIGSTTQAGLGVLDIALSQYQDPTPPGIVSYDPQSGSDQEISYRPIVRIEFSKPLNEASIGAGQIIVTDKNDAVVSGIQRYVAVNGKSVLHYLFSTDLNPDETYKVVLAPGLKDLSGNSLASSLQYTFTARPRERTLTTVIDNFDHIGTWRAPNYSGSTAGIDAGVTQVAIDNSTAATTESASSLQLNYLWLSSASSRLIREHNTAVTPKFSKDNVIQYYLFGDGSRSKFRIALRNGSAGAFWTHVPLEIDWVGWKLISWDLSNDTFLNWLVNDTGEMPAGDNLNLSALVLEPAATEYLAFSTSALWIDELQVVKLGDFISSPLPPDPPEPPVPAVVSSIEPADLDAVEIDRPLVLTFSRAMDKASVESAIGVAPAGALSFTWPDDYTLQIDLSELNYDTEYSLVIDGSTARDAEVYEPLCDNEGTVGGSYVLNFKTGKQAQPPAVIVSVAPDNLDAVEIDRPLVLTFSRAMDKASVESALGVAPAGALSCTWPDDYTLQIDLSELTGGTNYTLKIDASIAKDAETGQFLDGTNSGTPGGDYVLTFRTAEQHLSKPVVVSHDPADGAKPEVLRPIIRIQFSQPLDEATIAPNQISVADARQAPISGIQKYATVNGVGVMHYLFNADLTPGLTYKVKLDKGALADRYGNEIDLPAGGLEYSFTLKPRQVDVIQVIDDFDAGIGDWPVNPKANSATTVGVVEASTTVGASTETACVESVQSMQLNYAWEQDAASHVIRFTKNSATPQFTQAPDKVMQLYVFGDASNSKLRLTVRQGTTGGIWSCLPITVDWAGWKLIAWKPGVAADGQAWLAGDGPIPDGTPVNFACFGLHGAADIQYSPSFILFDDIRIVRIGDYLPTSISPVKTDDINTTVVDKAIQITASQAINDIRVYSINGAQVTSVQPGQTECRIPTDGWTPGVYIVKVAAGTTQKNMKALVK